MKFRKTKGHTVCRDLHAFADLVREWPAEGQRELAVTVNKLLDDLLAQDAFGTEGQCDPRGDHRD